MATYLSRLVTLFGVVLLAFLGSMALFPLVPDISPATLELGCRMLGAALTIVGLLGFFQTGRPAFIVPLLCGLGATFLPMLSAVL
jgi:hypothetical protein